MPLYLRKRIKIAPGLALNLSKSGLGISAGPKGFKVSHGSRGTQVNAGRGGLYYRKTIGGRGQGAGSRGRARPAAKASIPPVVPLSIGQMNGVALSGRQPTTGRWPNKSRPPVFAVGSWQFWLCVGIAVLLVALAGAF